MNNRMLTTGLAVFGLAVSAFAQIVPIPGASIDGPGTDLQSAFASHGITSNVVSDQVAERIFALCDPQTPATIDILFQYAAYKPYHKIGWYQPVGTQGATNYVVGGSSTGLPTSNTFAPIGLFSLALKLKNTGDKFWAETGLNGDGFAHAAVFLDRDETGQIVPCSYIVAWEDLKNGGDKDYNDIVVRVQNVNAVPEPGTITAIVAGLGALIMRRRRV